MKLESKSSPEPQCLCIKGKIYSLDISVKIIINTSKLFVFNLKLDINFSLILCIKVNCSADGNKDIVDVSTGNKISLIPN